MSKMALCFLWHTDETDKTDDNGSFYLLVIREKENLIRCHLFDLSYPVCFKNITQFDSKPFKKEYI